MTTALNASTGVGEKPQRKLEVIEVRVTASVEVNPGLPRDEFKKAMQRHFDNPTMRPNKGSGWALIGVRTIRPKGYNNSFTLDAEFNFGVLSPVQQPFLEILGQIAQKLGKEFLDRVTPEFQFDNHTLRINSWDGWRVQLVDLPEGAWTSGLNQMFDECSLEGAVYSPDLRRSVLKSTLLKETSS